MISRTKKKFTANLRIQISKIIMKRKIELKNSIGPLVMIEKISKYSSHFSIQQRRKKGLYLTLLDCIWGDFVLKLHILIFLISLLRKL